MPADTTNWVVLSLTYVGANNGGTLNLVVREGSTATSPRVTFVRSTPLGGTRRWVRQDTNVVIVDSATLTALAPWTQVADAWSGSQQAVLQAAVAAGYLP